MSKTMLMCKGLKVKPYNFDKAIQLQPTKSSKLDKKMARGTPTPSTSSHALSSFRAHDSSSFSQ